MKQPLADEITKAGEKTKRDFDSDIDSDDIENQFQKLKNQRYSSDTLV